ncbi:DUF2278 family protein [Calothrix sp. 336/3]|uniref:DUF2278 family protein n=1 Tax=Calothrix sp. 336/3 TaxID=1337936 RepID=UPI0004E46087|nr:DUF2278 family protein [Calothrix sp. 336/3]AKG23751.1 hypothetical protein IJ00_22845 [Calothrix sp. 336/3]
MPLKNYGVLKCRGVDRKLGEGPTPHYQVLVSDNNLQHRIAINVKSKESPSELLYYIDSKFDHPILKGLVELDYGFHEINRQPGGLAIDLIRGNLLDVSQMKPLPHNVPGPDNDLNELIDLYIGRSLNSDATIYAFGEKWGPENDVKDKYFGFLPGNGIHDIHMNQGNVDRFQKDDGVWQDGGLIIHYPSRNQWVGIFLAFQSQTFHTDDTTGHRLDDIAVTPTAAAMRIVAAAINPLGDDSGKETVILINSSPEVINLTNWSLADKLKQKYRLQGTINPGETLKVQIPQKTIQLDNQGGIITLLNDKGIKIDGVSYTKEDAQKQGWMVIF